MVNDSSRYERERKEIQHYSQDAAAFLSLRAIPTSSKGNKLAGKFTLEEGSNVNV